MADVKEGLLAPDEIQPYAVWELDLPFATGERRLGAVSYDAETNRLFVPQLDVLAYEWDLDLYPGVHVFQLSTPALTADVDHDNDVDDADFLAL